MRYFSPVVHDMGKILLFIAAISTLPLLIMSYYGEWGIFLPMATAPVSFGFVGWWLSRKPQDGSELRLSVALAAVALIWLMSAIIGSLPFILGLGMPFTDSVFEAMSGWTSTGLSLLPSVDTAPYTLLFWRSLMQWTGGIGIVAFTIAIANRSGLLQRNLYRSEGRSEAFMPSVVATATQMWRIYIIITIFSIGVILISGVPLWDALNLSMTAIATGGFSVHSAGISYYHNPVLEMLLIPIMIAGALPFKLYYMMYLKRKIGIFGNRQAKLLFAFIGIGAIVVTLDLITGNFLDPVNALRQGSFMVTSAITCTGFQNANPFYWSGATVLFVSIIMLIGGSSGSTAGGIKLNRILLGIEGLIWWFKRIFLSTHVVIPFRHEGKSIPRNIADIELSKNMLIIILFILTVLVCSLAVMHFDSGTRFESGDVIFEVVSAMSNVGISNGFVNPEMSLFSKWFLIFVMWFGRLELVPVIVLFVGLGKGFD